jgi:ribonuclease J
MRVCIHRGAAQIGGSCVEVEAGGARIVLDVGLPLDAALGEDPPLPPVPGLAGEDAGTSLLGVIISHPHLDHWGLAPALSPAVPLFLGEAAERILQEAAFFSPAGARLHASGRLRNREPISLGPFRITPLLMDHSAFDAYALLVEAEGKRLFYTGDFRGHGRKAALFRRLLREPPADVDTLLIEGTLVGEGKRGARASRDERSVEQECIRAFKATPGMALVVYSAQNIDRLVTLYKAALQADRDFVMDLYAATIARATGRQSIPQPGPQWPRVKVFVPLKQRIDVLEAAEFDRVRWIRDCRIFPEDLAAQRARLVMTFRSSMARELEREAGCLEGASIVWSLWDGYLERDQRLRDFQARHSLELVRAHCSGHAGATDLRRLIEALRPARVVPIHTAAPEAFSGLSDRVDLHPDGEWWPV